MVLTLTVILIMLLSINTILIKLNVGNQTREVSKYMRVSAAATPCWVGINEGDTYSWIYTTNTTNMAGAWTTDDVATLQYLNMDNAYNGWIEMMADPSYNPGNMSHTITAVGTLTADIEYGSNYQVVPFTNDMVFNATFGGVIWDLGKDGSYAYPGVIIENATEFVLWHDGLSNWFNLDFTPASWPQNSIAVPRNFDWDEVATAANTELADNNATVTALSDGFQITVAASAWGNNTLALELEVTFDECGLLNLWELKYGGDSILEVRQVVGAEYKPCPPLITASPSDFAVAHNYTGQSLSWTATTDMNPNTYTITLNGTTTVVPALAWTNGTPIIYNIPDGLSTGPHTYEITFSNMDDETVSDTVVFTVNPAPAQPPESFTLSSDADFPDDDGIFGLSWTISNGADNYSIYMHNTPITVIDSTLTLIVDQTAMSPFSVTGLSNGEYYFVVVAHNQNGDTLSNNVHVTVEIAVDEISGYNTLVVLGIVIITGVILFKRKKIKYISK